MNETYKTKLTPKQKAKLKALANPIGHRYLLGKAEVDEGFLTLIDNALEAKELIKVGLLQTCPMSAKEVASIIESKLSADIAQIIGRVIVVYRRSKKHHAIEVD